MNGPVDGLAESCVTYDGLPISSGGAHALSRLSARVAVDRWFHFLETCTDPSPVECWYSLPVTPGLTVDPAVDWLIASRFPGGRNRRAVPDHRLPEALSLLESIQPQPTNQWGMAPVWLWLTADFRLRSPSGELWPGQDRSRFGHFVTPGGISLGASSTRLILQAKPAMGLVLSIPDATDPDLAELVPWLQAALPMRMSSKHWVRWTRTKGGDSYRGRRIQPGQ